jgi:CRP/FNR family transcriptional regulator, cyclic AMP receptor protein
MPDIDVLADFAVLGALSAEQRRAVAATGREVGYSARDVVFEEGQPADGCWLILSGHVALSTEVPGRGPVVVQTLGPGEVLGWSWLIAPRRWHFRAVAVVPVEALELDTSQLRALADQDPALGYALTLGLFAALLDRLQSTRARLLDLYRSPRER